MMHARLRHRRPATRVETAAIMDLFAWAEMQPAVPGVGHNGGPTLEPEVSFPRQRRAQKQTPPPGAPKNWRGHYCACGTPISPQSRGKCKPCAYVTLNRPVPDGFFTVLKTKGSVGAAEFYRASLSTVTQWRNDLGIRPHSRAKKPIVKPKPFFTRALSVHRDFTHVGQAADFLRRFGPVSRCDANGKYHADGEWWNRNGFVLSGEELMAKATRLGWSPVGI